MVKTSKQLKFFLVSKWLLCLQTNQKSDQKCPKYNPKVHFWKLLKLLNLVRFSMNPDFVVWLSGNHWKIISISDGQCSRKTLASRSSDSWNTTNESATVRTGNTLRLVRAISLALFVFFTKQLMPSVVCCCKLNNKIILC